MITPFQAARLPASFRGVPFIVEENGGEAGRRGQVHEYWGRDTPYAEDGGKRARRIEFRGYVLGDDCALQRDALLIALETKGPGLLVHPSMPPALMQPDPMRPARWRESWDRNRRIEFDLTFVEPGQLVYPVAGADTQASSNMAADNVSRAADQDMIDKTNAVAPPAGAAASPPGTPDAPQQAAQVEVGEVMIVPQEPISTQSVTETATTAGAGPGTVETLAAHAAMDDASPSPAQAAAAGGATMTAPTPDKLPDDADAAAMIGVLF